MTPVRLEPAALQSRVKHSTTEPLRSLHELVHEILVLTGITHELVRVILILAIYELVWDMLVLIKHELVHGV